MHRREQPMAGILIIDPSPLCRELAASFLEHNGFAVCACPDPMRAIAALPQLQPDLILLEPGDNGGGFAFLQTMRADPRWRDLPVLILTDTGTRESILRAGALGVRDYMLKPRFTRSELLTRVRKYLAAPSRATPAKASPKPPAAAPSPRLAPAPTSTTAP